MENAQEHTRASGGFSYSHGNISAAQTSNYKLVQKSRSYGKARTNYRDWMVVAFALLTATLLGLLFEHFGLSEVNIVMLYLAAIVFVAARSAILPSIISSFLAVLVFDVLFTVPHYSITVEDTEYLFTFGVMLGVSLLVSSLTGIAKREAELSRRSERHIESLYNFSQQLAGLSDVKELIAAAENAAAEMFTAKIFVLIPHSRGHFQPSHNGDANFLSDPNVLEAAQWTINNIRESGAGTDAFPDGDYLLLPLVGQTGPVGVLAFTETDLQRFGRTETRQLLNTCCSQIALSIERCKLRSEAQDAELQAETERLRSALLSSVSHDLRTPLSAITGASSSLLEKQHALSTDTKFELISSIYNESQRLSRHVDNILNMTRLTSGKISVNTEWHPLEDVIGSALRTCEKQLCERKVILQIEPDTALGSFDAVLIEQMLINLLDNAVKYSPANTEIAILGRSTADSTVFEVADRGRGLNTGEERRIFELFFRGANEKADRQGTGLGLAICKAIIDAHRGKISAENRNGGGTLFQVEIPFTGAPPAEIVEGFS